MATSLTIIIGAHVIVWIPLWTPPLVTIAWYQGWTYGLLVGQLTRQIIRISMEIIMYNANSFS